jgi:CheY-like chemotaxis protein
MTFAHVFLMEHRPLERSSVMTPIQERLYSAAPHAERISACRRKRSGSDCSGNRDPYGRRPGGFDGVRRTARRDPGDVARLGPDVVRLDGANPTEYGQSWCTAAWLNERDRRTPVVMFTAHAQDLAEAQLGESARSRRAAFAGIVAKPFDLQVLVDVVARAVRQPTGMDVSTMYLN